MKTIDSYNSSYPLAFYEIGTVYSFYGQVNAKGTPAPADAIQKYASVLNDLVVEEQGNAIKPVKESGSSATAYNGVNRFYAVVIDKAKKGKYAYIVVMLCNKYNGRSEYYTRTYSVNFGCVTDGKDLMPASSHLGFESKITGKVGGVTLVGTGAKVGGITRANGKNTSTSGVGGITRVQHPTNQSSGNSPKSGKVGGITLVREQKVGGITRVKK